MVLLYFIALHFHSRWVAIAAAGSLAVLHGHTLYSRLGLVDHHVLVAAVSTVMLALVLVWPGGLFHVGVIQIGMLVRLATVVDKEDAIVWTTRFAWIHLVACLVVFPLSVGNEWVWKVC